MGSLTLRHPDQKHDDIHPSAVAIYVMALVHYATLYPQSPVGLAPLAGMGPRLARALQCAAWDTVINDPRTGVEAVRDPACLTGAADSPQP